MALAKKRFSKFKKAVSEVQRVLRILIAKEMIRERDELYLKEARAKAAAVRLAEARAKLEKEKQEKERLEKERLEKEKERLEKQKERSDKERLEKEQQAEQALAVVEQDRLQQEMNLAISAALDKVAEDFMEQAKLAAPPKPAPKDDHEALRLSEVDSILNELALLEKEVMESEQAAEMAQAMVVEAAQEADAAEEVEEQTGDAKAIVRSTSKDSIGSDGGHSDFSFVKYGKAHFSRNLGPFFSKVLCTFFFFLLLLCPSETLQQQTNSKSRSH